MSEKRLGRQTPTTAFVLPYRKTHGEEAINLYNNTGRTAQPWQELLIYDMLAYNDDDLWVHTKYGYAVPRQNGKNEIVIIRELYGLLVLGERIIHTAHRTTRTRHSVRAPFSRASCYDASVFSVFCRKREHRALILKRGRCPPIRRRVPLLKAPQRWAQRL